MAKLEELGKVLETDVLVIGGGMAGMSSAINAKESYPDLDVLIIERDTIGLAGLSTKSGHGWVILDPKIHDVEEFVKYQVKESTDWMCNQDLLRKYAGTICDVIEKAQEWGVVFPKNPDGSIQVNPHPTGKWGNTALPLNVNKTVSKYAKKVGVRMINRMQAIDFIMDGEVIAGLLAMNIDDMTTYIIKAKSFVLCTSGCSYNVGQMFNGVGDGIAMTYRAGAEMRNCEFGTGADVVYKNDGHPIYGAHELIVNAKGENLHKKYAATRHEVSLDLMLGMEKEMELGNGPLYANLDADETGMLAAIGGQGQAGEEPGVVNGVRRLWPDALDWQGKILQKAEKYRAVEDENPRKPLVTGKLAPEISPIRVDDNYKTSLTNLWAAGSVCYQGAAEIAWVRGDGVAGALHTGMWAGPGAADYAVSNVNAQIDPEQVKALKERFYAPLHNKDGMDAREMMDKISDIVINPKYILHRCEENLVEGLEKVAELQAELPKMVAEDGHMLAKCREMEGLLTVTEMSFQAARMRKESRGVVWRHHRDDYPDTDNKNWLKWIIVAKRDGEMKLWTEDIPYDRYLYHPDDM